PGVLARRRHVPRLDRPARGCRGVRLLRRPALRQRPAPLRAPAHRLRQGRHPAVPHHVRRQGGPPLRLGHPRTARRARGDAGARHDREVRDRGDGAEGVQQRREGLGAEVHQGVGGVRHPPGPLGRLRERLQDPRRHLHGVRAVGVQDALRQGPRLRGLLRAALLLEGPDAAVRARAADGRRRLPGAPGPDRHRHVPLHRAEGRRARARGRQRPGLDHHPLDPAHELLPRRRPRARVLRGARRPARRRRRHRRGGGPLPDGDRSAGRLRQGARLRGRRGDPRRRRAAGLHRLRARARRVRPAVNATCSSSEPEHVAYTPLWTVYSEDRSTWGTQNAWIVTVADYVSTDDGTGVVHQATAYGEIDQQVNAAYGIPVIVSVDDGAQFLDYFAGTELDEIAGVQVFEANRPIIRNLQRAGRLLREASYVHSYPHCWRCRNPLIYKAVSSWYVKVADQRERMLELNEQIDWVPGNVKHGQFGRWLEGARDW